MSNEFAQIYAVAEVKRKQNLITQDERNMRCAEEEAKTQEQKNEKRASGRVTADPSSEAWSNELFGLIHKFGFVIESYEKFTKLPYDDETPIEIYYCAKNGWRFEVQNLRDVDITEGIFAAREVVNKATGEKVEFYCDLGCRNTGQALLDTFLKFLEFDSLQSYIDSCYYAYTELPRLLREEGFAVEEINYKFGLNEAEGWLKLENKLFVKVYRAWSGDLKVVATNEEKWGINSGQHSVDGAKAYYFNYRSINDIKAFCECIRAFKEHAEGRIGYFENGAYYSNRDVKEAFAPLKQDNAGNEEAWNTHLIRLDIKRGYNENNSKILNKYKGLEVYVEAELRFNDAYSWSVGDFVNKSFIIFEYDRRKSNQCRLKIENFVYGQAKRGQSENMVYSEESDARQSDHKKLISAVELRGSFLELREKLSEYVRNMGHIHGVIN